MNCGYLSTDENEFGAWKILSCDQLTNMAAICQTIKGTKISKGKVIIIIIHVRKSDL